MTESSEFPPPLLLPSPETPASPSDGEGSDATRQACAKLIGGGSALLVAGAGCSVPANFPAWLKLLGRLEAVGSSVTPGFSSDATARESDPLSYATRIRDQFAVAKGGLDRYYAELQAQFRGPPRLTQFHHDLVALPFRGFLTTNYDDTLESALALRDADRQPPDKAVVVADGFPMRTREFLNGLTRAGAGRRVAHLHGYHVAPSTIVLGSGDYQRVYGDRGATGEPPPLVRFLESILSTWSLVFVGFSFRDPYLRAFLESSANRYFMWGRAEHFAYVGTTDASRAVDQQRAAELLERFGVASVFYDNDDGSHAALYALLRELRHSLGIAANPSLDELNERTLGRLLE